MAENEQSVDRTPVSLMTTNHVILLGAFMVVAAVAHALLAPSSRPLQVGTIVGELHVREANGIAHLKCNDCRVECYESFVVVYIDREKQPTWTGNYIKTIPWSKIEHMTLADPNAKS